MNTVTDSQSISVSPQDDNQEYDFLLKLINEEDILKYYPKCSLPQNDPNRKMVKFSLKKERVGFPGIGSITISRQEQRGVITERLELRLWRIWGAPEITKNENEWHGYVVFMVGLSMNSKDQFRVSFKFQDKDITSPSTEYGLKIFEKVRILFGKK